jgi:hypothetical protein
VESRKVSVVADAAVVVVAVAVDVVICHCSHHLISLHAPATQETITLSGGG